MRFKLWPCLLAFLAVLGMIPAFAEDKVEVTGDAIWGDTEKRMTFIKGNVRIVQGSDIITGDNAKINLDEKILLLDGKVAFRNQDVTITADNLEYNMKKKKGNFRSHVVLQRKEVKKTKESVKKDPFSLFTEELYFEVNTKNFTAVSARIEHKDFTGSADRIDYQDKLQEMIFRGNSYLKKPKGEEVCGEITRINLKDKSFIVENKVKVSFDVGDDDEGTDKKTETKKNTKREEDAKDKEKIESSQTVTSQ